MEPKVIYATVRDGHKMGGHGHPVFPHDIECRFSDGQKFAAIEVDEQFPQLAKDIAEWLNSRASVDYTPALDRPVFSFK